jgi:Na+/H+ antiporter NhaA
MRKVAHEVLVIKDGRPYFITNDVRLTSRAVTAAFGLLIGKPVGITLLSCIAVSLAICRLPLDLNWKHAFGAGLLGGIGFTMSIFITNLAFACEAGCHQRLEDSHSGA